MKVFIIPVVLLLILAIYCLRKTKKGDGFVENGTEI